MGDNFLQRLLQAHQQGIVSEKTYHIFKEMFLNYVQVIQGSQFPKEYAYAVFESYLDAIEYLAIHPCIFQAFHPMVRQPLDYYELGLRFTRPLIKKVQLLNSQHIHQIQLQLAQGDNVVFLSNHQSELDPQIFSVALEQDYLSLAKDIIFVAGDRVLNDPLAVPLSMGRNLLCIYSKRHIDQPPEKKAEKLVHNQKAMKMMSSLLQEGGKAIYVAPSGGRDRPNQQGNVVIADFDPNSIEMFKLMARQAGKKTHFYPLSLSTYAVLPPPDTIEVELEEMRRLRRTVVGFAFGASIDMTHFPGSDHPDRHEKRKALAQHIWNLVQQGYQEILRNTT